LGSRSYGEIIREEIESAVESGNSVIIDFEGIEGITQSFGDEIVGIFVRNHGVDYIKENISIINANDEIRSVLNFVVKYSKKYYSAA